VYTRHAGDARHNGHIQRRQLSRHAVVIGETYVANIAALAEEYGSGRGQSFTCHGHTTGHARHPDVANSAPGPRRREASTAHTAFRLRQSRQPRLDMRYGDGVHNSDITRHLHVLFASRGPPVLLRRRDRMKTTRPPQGRREDPVGVTGCQGKGPRR